MINTLLLGRSLVYGFPIVYVLCVRAFDVFGWRETFFGFVFVAVDLSPPSSALTLTTAGLMTRKLDLVAWLRYWPAKMPVHCSGPPLNTPSLWHRPTIQIFSGVFLHFRAGSAGLQTLLFYLSLVVVSCLLSVYLRRYVHLLCVWESIVALMVSSVSFLFFTLVLFVRLRTAMI